MKEKVIEILKEVLETSEINESTTQKDCEEWDSMAALNIVVELESEFGVSLEPEDIAQMDSVESICKIVSSKI